MPDDPGRRGRREAVKKGVEIRVEPDEAAAMQAAADGWMEAAQSAVAAAGCASIAISGGRTPRGMHRLLARPPYAAGISWDRVHLFWADERLVGPEHPASNFGAARTDFLQSLPQPPGGLYPVPVSRDGDASARRYEEELRRHFHQRHLDEPDFDLILLGLGADGHTASLFPGSPVLSEQRRWAAAVQGGEPDVERVTLTYPVLNGARRILFLVTGESKAAAVRHVVTGAKPLLPAQRVRPRSGCVSWVIDREAASLLPHSLFCV
jgi:6-phosphogluconolactonase